MIYNYFDQIKSIVNSYLHIIASFRINEKVYSEERGFIEGEITFTDESRLDFAEVKDMEIPQKIKYHYHYMDTDNTLLFRYDNAKHHKGIKTFPHHKHTPSQIEDSAEPELRIVLNEVESMILRK